MFPVRRASTCPSRAPRGPAEAAHVVLIAGICAKVNTQGELTLPRNTCIRHWDHRVWTIDRGWPLTRDLRITRVEPGRTRCYQVNRIARADRPSSLILLSWQRLAPFYVLAPRPPCASFPLPLPATLSRRARVTPAAPTTSGYRATGAGGRPEEGWRKAGGRLAEGWRKAGGRLEEGWRKAGGRLAANLPRGLLS
jgi:hypothetical protein